MDHARTYLSNFGAVPRIYQDMLTAAEKASPGIDFNRQYANSAASVVEPHFVRGAFTRSGFAFMQDAIQHPARYFQGETWVLGDQAARSLDTASVSKQLAAMYSGDFIKEWHAFLTEARVVGCGSLKEAPDKLNALAGPESPILEFFYTVSSNTAVADPQIKAIFQPAQALVDPNATARFIGPGNTNYVNALLSLSGAVNQFNQNPDTSRDQLNAAVSAAGSGGTADRAGLQRRSADAHGEDGDRPAGVAHQVRRSPAAPSTSGAARIDMHRPGQVPLCVLVQNPSRQGFDQQRTGQPGRGECSLCAGHGKTLDVL